MKAEDKERKCFFVWVTEKDIFRVFMCKRERKSKVSVCIKRIERDAAVCEIERKRYKIDRDRKKILRLKDRQTETERETN